MAAVTTNTDTRPAKRGSMDVPESGDHKSRWEILSSVCTAISIVMNNSEKIIKHTHTYTLHGQKKKRKKKGPT